MPADRETLAQPSRDLVTETKPHRLRLMQAVLRLEAQAAERRAEQSGKPPGRHLRLVTDDDAA